MMDQKRVLWYYRRKTDDQLNESSDGWIPHCDIEMEIIEAAYRSKRAEVFLDQFHLDLINFIQYDRTDPSIEYILLRRDDCPIEKCLREERFFSSIHSLLTPSHGSAQAGCSFLNAWLKTAAGKRALFDFSSAVQACADGIRQEALVTSTKTEIQGNWMAEQLLALKGASRREVAQVCINFYTRESFLYRVLNAALREQDHSKLSTLGPLCFLIRNIANAGSEFIGTVYRGVQFSSEMIESYKQSISLWRTWPSYTSTTKNREIAEIRGNVLFTIRIYRSSVSGAALAYDIERISHFPSEEEVLLAAGIAFQILSVDDSSPKKIIIEIRI